MRAAVCRAYGPPESIDVCEVPPPALSAGQLRVRVRAAAVNYPDVLLMAGKYQVTLDVPFVPGSESRARWSRSALTLTAASRSGIG